MESGEWQDIKIREDRWLKSGITGGEELSGEPQMVNELINTEQAKWDEQKLFQMFDKHIAEENFNYPNRGHQEERQSYADSNKSQHFHGQECVQSNLGIREQAEHNPAIIFLPAPKRIMGHDLENANTP